MKIKSYKLSPQLRAELGRARRKTRGAAFTLPSIRLPKIPWKPTIGVVLVCAVVVGGWAGVKRVYETRVAMAEIARQERLEQYQNHLQEIRSQVAAEGTDAYSFAKLSQKYLKEGDGERAEAAAQMAVEKDENWRDGHLNLGQVYLALEKFEDARGALEGALEIDPLCGHAHYMLSLVHQELNQSDEAKEAFAKAKAFGFETEIGG